MRVMKLLVVEDEVKTANTLKKGLEEKGYEVLVANEGETAYDLACRIRFDLIISDVVMPRLNGIDFCRKLRENQIQTPLIMLTALGMTTDKIKGFDAGSDDYLVKPFDFEELLARIRVQLNRHYGKATETSELVYSDIRINLITKEVFRSSQLITLTAKEYALLEFFVRNAGRVISKEEIAEKVWDVSFDTGTNIIEVYVSYLRNRIDKDFKTKVIHTKKGMGYIFREEK
jgi:two-component system, OmpR family, copper resistance phosphate regulon response regulator CusR